MTYACGTVFASGSGSFCWGPGWPANPPCAGLAEIHDGALLLLGTGESQRVARRSLGQLTAGGSRVLGCVAIA